MKKILEHIKTNTYPKFYLFYGSEKYMVSQMKEQLKNALVSKEDTMNYSYFEGKNTDSLEVAELAKTLPFFSDHRLIILDQTGLGKKTDDKFLEQLKECADTTVMIFVEDDVDKRSKIYKYLSKEGHVVSFEAASDKDLAKWIQSLLKREQKQMSSPVLRSFLYRCGSDMFTLKNELEKLVSYTDDRTEITQKDLDALTSSQTTNQIFVMLEAIARKQRDKVLTLYYDLIELKESPFGILALLVRQCNQLLQVKDLESRGQNNSTIAKKIKVPPFVVGKLKEQAKLFRMDTLYQMVEACAKTDEQIKSGIISDRVGVELLLIEFSQ
ncbi:DNA polymerase III subunit delta [Anaerostipes faecalis]|uniref:DNA polymerase III subunit delta n=1 Tax=Anaerostipes faecalis TaxID=2738446 RepID=UPI001C1DD886|nr:DNA polymerase III subunit delta [Anaerostipes faecalis]